MKGLPGEVGDKLGTREARPLSGALRNGGRTAEELPRRQVDMTLDVDSTNNLLIISEDLRSVGYGHNKQNREERAERFSYAVCILGSSRFTSGRHYWEVEMGTGTEWDLGVCKESANRKGTILRSSDYGFWTLGLRDGNVFSASTKPHTAVWVNTWLHQVGIFLDMNIGNLSFWDITDGSHTFTFSNIPVSEPLCPSFLLQF